MTKKVKDSFYCNNCGKSYVYEFYTRIDAPLEASFKKILFEGDFFIRKCPYCGCEEIIIKPLAYVDSENKFVILLNNYIELYDLFEEIKKGSSNFYNSMGISNDYKVYGVCSFQKFIEAIAILENGLDYRVALLLAFSAHQQFADSYREIHNTDIKIPELFFTYNDKDELALVTVIQDNGQTKRIGMLFSNYKETYEQLYNHCKDDLYRIETDLFDHFAIYKYIRYFNKKNLDVNQRLQMALCEDMEGNNFYAYIPPYNFNRFKEGDLLCVFYNKIYTKAYIHHIVNTTLEKSPVDPLLISKAMWRCGTKKLVTTGDSNDVLDNAHLLGAFKKYNETKNNRDFPNELIMTSNVIVGVVPIVQLSDEEAKRTFNDDSIFELYKKINPKFELETRKYGDKILLCVYLEQKNVKNDVSKCIYNFNDVMDMIYNHPELYAGIVINPDDEKITYSYNKLRQYKHDRYMTNSGRMIDLLGKLTNDEINYMSTDGYKIICMVYYEGKTPKQIASELQRPEKDIHDALDYGYKRMAELVERY